MTVLWLLAGFLAVLVVVSWFLPETVLEALGRRVRNLIWEDIDLSKKP